MADSTETTAPVSEELVGAALRHVRHRRAPDVVADSRFAPAANSSRCLALVLVLVSAADGRAQGQLPDRPAMEIYGFGQTDAIADFNQNDPNRYDVNRPSRLPSRANQFGEDGRFYLSARQSRIGVRATTPTSMGDANGTIEFDLFGVGPDAGLTTIRLRHAYGQFKQIGADRRTASSWTPMCSRIFLITGRQTACSSPERPGVLGTVQERRFARSDCDRETWRQRRRGCVCRPRRTPERCRPLPLPGFHRPLPGSDQLGVTYRSAVRFATSATTTSMQTARSI